MYLLEVQEHKICSIVALKKKEKIYNCGAVVENGRTNGTKLYSTFPAVIFQFTFTTILFLLDIIFMHFTDKKRAQNPNSEHKLN